MELTPRLVRAVLAVRDTGRTTLAAERVGLTQSAVSKAVASAEQRLGVRLFDRAGGRLSPRAEAAELFEALDAFDLRWRALAQAAPALRLGGARPLTIVATPSLAQGLAARAVARLLEQVPGARVRLLTTVDPVAAVTTGRAEIGLMFSPRAGPDIAVTPLARIEMVCLVPSRHPLAQRGGPVQPADLAGERLICFDRDLSPLGRAMAGWCSAAGRLYAPFIEVPYSITAAHLVAAGCGIAAVDALCLGGVPLDALAVLPLMPAVSTEAMAMTRAGRPLSGLAGRLLELLTAEAGRTPLPERAW